MKEYISFILESSAPKALTIQDIEKAYNRETRMEMLVHALRVIDRKMSERLWKSDILKPFAQIRDELTVAENDIGLRGTRLVIPDKAQAQAIRLAHRGSQGMLKTKQLFREKIWFPGIDTKVEAAVKNCEACQSTVVKKKCSPLKMSSLPDGPWQSLATDFAGRLYLLVSTTTSTYWWWSTSTRGSPS